MNNKQILYSVLAVVGLFGALYGVYLLLNTGPDATLIKKLKEDKPVARTMWNKKADHTLVVFSDFQCPACKVYDEYLAGFQATSSPEFAITKNISYVFRYYPLYQIHPHAFYLAYSAEAAARQGKFEPVAKRFFADQEKVAKVTDIKGYVLGVVKELGLDVNRFQKDVDDKALQGVVSADLQLGESLAVNATPTFFLDGKQLESVAPLDLMKLLKEVR